MESNALFLFDCLLRDNAFMGIIDTYISFFTKFQNVPISLKGQIELMKNFV